MILSCQKEYSAYEFRIFHDSERPIVLTQGYRMVSSPLRGEVEEGVFHEKHYSTPSPESPPLKGGGVMEI
jgi:hypothetical protein